MFISLSNLNVKRKGGGDTPSASIERMKGKPKVIALLNEALKEELMAGWLERLIGQPVVYSPLPAFV